MSEYMFGAGRGHLSDEADEIAHRHGAYLVNHTGDQCNCGMGCWPGQCERAARHWFATRNYGEPFDSATARAVMRDLAAAGIGKP